MIRMEFYGLEVTLDDAGFWEPGALPVVELGSNFDLAQAHLVWWLNRTHGRYWSPEELTYIPNHLVAKAEAAAEAYSGRIVSMDLPEAEPQDDEAIHF